MIGGASKGCEEQVARSNGGREGEGERSTAECAVTPRSEKMTPEVAERKGALEEGARRVCAARRAEHERRARARRGNSPHFPSSAGRTLQRAEKIGRASK